jgi:hypothetical protein
MRFSVLQVVLIAVGAAYLAERCLFFSALQTWVRQGGGAWPTRGCL